MPTVRGTCAAQLSSRCADAAAARRARAPQRVRAGGVLLAELAADVAVRDHALVLPEKVARPHSDEDSLSRRKRRRRWRRRFARAVEVEDRANAGHSERRRRRKYNTRRSSRI